VSVAPEPSRDATLTNGPTLAVVLCTYNGGRFLPEQLKSLASQTRLPDVLFVRDDDSTDETPEILRSFATTAPFHVDVRRNPERLGYNRNYAAAIEGPETDLLALCDQDDVWYPHKLSVLCNLLAQDPEAAAACGDAQCVSVDGASLGTSIWRQLGFDPGTRQAMAHTGEMGPLLRNNVVQGSSLVLRSSFRDLVLPFSVHGTYDYWTAALLQAVSHIVFAPEPLQEYRIHETNAVGIERPGQSLRRALRQWRRQRVVYGRRTEQPGGGPIVPLRARRIHDHGDKAAFCRELLERASASRYEMKSATRARLEEWAEFTAFRARLPAHLARRVRPVAREVRRGGYASHVASPMSALYDIVLG
jgi:Glycosyl transferase family 2